MNELIIIPILIILGYLLKTHVYEFVASRTNIKLKIVIQNQLGVVDPSGVQSRFKIDRLHRFIIALSSDLQNAVCIHAIPKSIHLLRLKEILIYCSPISFQNGTYRITVYRIDYINISGEVITEKLDYFNRLDITHHSNL